MVGVERSVALLVRAVGKSLQSLAENPLVADGKREGRGCLELGFADGIRLTLTIRGDGESVWAHSRGLALQPPYVANDVRYEVPRIDLFEDDPDLGRLQGAQLKQVSAVIEKNASRQPAGWLLEFDSGDCVGYFNHGDEPLILVNEPPPPFTGSELSTVVLS